MLVDVLTLVAGLVFLLGGGEALVRGASQIASSTGVPPLVIGLTIVAFGTSAPELAVNLVAAWEGTSDLSFGNIFGSNMANIGLILGTSGMIRALSIRSVIVSREIPMMMVATIAALIMSLDAWLGEGASQFDRIDGMMLLLLFCVFLYYTVGGLTTQRERNQLGLDTEAELGGARGGRAAPRSALIAIAGLGALLLGAHYTVDGAVGLARAFGISEVIIGLTMVALGTSLPELVTAVIATLRGHIDLAVGNVVGSNIFNILLVAGATSVLRPMEVPPGGHTDLVLTLALSGALWWVSTTQNRRIVRAEASLLLLIYIGYVVWRTLSNGT